MYSIESHVGRLIEVRFWSPASAGESIGWRRDHEAMLRSVLGNVVTFVDMTDANVFPPDMVEAYVATMRNEPRLLRAALVLGASPTLSLQIQRMLRDVNQPHRRAFREAREAEAWLGEVVTMAERTRLREVVDRRIELGGPSSAEQPVSAGAPPSRGTPPSFRAPSSGPSSGPSSASANASANARATTPTTRLPVTPRSPSGGQQG